eukprot:758232-Hanusia_phi.AAC.3
MATKDGRGDEGEEGKGGEEESKEQGEEEKRKKRGGMWWRKNADGEVRRDGRAVHDRRGTGSPKYKLVQQSTGGTSQEGRRERELVQGMEVFQQARKGRGAKETSGSEHVLEIRRGMNQQGRRKDQGQTHK